MTVVALTSGSSNWVVPAGVTAVSVLVVAGGGGGGALGGGGGGGGYVYNANYAVTPLANIPYTVGAGGASKANGANSMFGTLSATGGGSGGSNPSGQRNGGNGGSGGGGGSSSGGAGNGGNATAGQGSNGGNGTTSANAGCGGGGGATSPGVNGTTTTGGGGGDGIYFGNIFGDSYGASGWFCGGGGGATYAGGTPGLGKHGGANGVTDANGLNATPNTGGGGGGGGFNLNGGTGGSGIILIFYSNEQHETVTDNAQIGLDINQSFSQGFAFKVNAKLGLELNQSAYKAIPGYGPAKALFSEPLEIQQISLTFDQLGNPLVFYRVGANTLKLYWYDPVLQQNVTTVLASGTDPQAGFDFPQDTGQDFTDALIFYVRNDTVYMRVQRDRFSIEYECPASQPGIRLVSNGLRVDNRYQAVYEYLADDYVPPIVPVPDIPVLGDNYYLHNWGSCLISNHFIDVVSQPFKLGFKVRDAFYPRGPTQYMFGSDDRRQLYCVIGSGSITIYRGYRWGAAQIIVPDGDFNGEWEFEFFGLNGDVVIKKDGAVLFDGFLVRPQPNKARPTNIVFAGSETVPDAECVTLRGAVYDCWVEQDGTRIDWPVRTKGNAVQPSFPPGTDMLIKNHRQQNWIRRG